MATQGPLSPRSRRDRRRRGAAPIVQDALPRDHASAAVDGLLEPEPPERSDAIGRKKDAGADLLLLDRALYDLGGEPPLPKRPRQRQPGDSPADDQDSRSSEHRCSAGTPARGRQAPSPSPERAPEGGAMPRMRGGDLLVGLRSSDQAQHLDLAGRETVAASVGPIGQERVDPRDVRTVRQGARRSPRGLELRRPPA